MKYKSLFHLLIKKVIISVVALSMIAPLAFQSVDVINPNNVTVNARRRHRRHYRKHYRRHYYRRISHKHHHKISRHHPLTLKQDINKYNWLYANIMKSDSNYKQELRAEKHYKKMAVKLFNNNLSHYSNRQLRQISRIPNIKSIVVNDNNDTMPQVIKQEEFTRNHPLSSLTEQDTPFDTELRTDLINDINNTREGYGLNPLTITPAMQATADYRAPLVLEGYENPNGYSNYENITPAEAQSQGGTTDNWIHGTDTDTSGGDYLQNHSYDYNDWNANAGAIYHNQPLSYTGTPFPYPNDTPQHIAYNMNNDYVNNDMGDENNDGHRQNELSPNFKYLGVGVAYDPQTKLIADNEQFYE